MNTVATFALIGLLTLSSASVIYAAKNETGSQQAPQGSNNQPAQNPSLSPTIKSGYNATSPTGVQVKNQVQTQNMGEESQLQVNTQTEEQLMANEDKQGASKTASPRSETAKAHMSTVSGIVENLLVSTSLKGGIGDQVKEIAQQQKTAQDEMQSELAKIDGRNQLLKALIGPDYMSLKKMQQAMSQNEERIQKLIELQNQLTNTGDKTMIEEAIQALTEQNLALGEQVSFEERTGSAFGWLFRYFAR